MATYTSSQSGPFDVASTWGGAGVPGDGDSFNVSQGHIVAVTGDSRPTNGFQDSNVYGKLHLQGSGCMLRMNGTLLIDSLTNAYFSEGSNSAPYFRMDPGSVLELRGTNADAHRLYVRNENYIQVEILGTNPNPQTTISSDISPSGSPGPISFTDASDFAPGDWITVYMPERTGKSWIYNRSDESFWVHDVDGNNVYFRQFVGPESTIVAASVNKIVVNDAKVFRKGYHLIFGSEANRNVRTIADISYGTNTITLNNNISGSVIGEKVYQTGSDKHHISGDKVLRLAAVTTQDAAVGANSIVVNNTNGFNVGDRILIQPNSEDYNEVSYGNFIADYTITNINTSTNVITFTNGYVSSAQTTLQKKTNAGALVVNINRDTKITAPEGTTYGSDQRSSIYVQGTGGYYYRRIKIKNVLINIGAHSDYNNYSIIGMRGSDSYDLTSYGQYTSEFEGNVIYPVYRYYRNTGYMWEQHQRNFRNNISYNAGTEGFYFYGNNVGLFGNIFMCNASWGTNCGSFMSNDQHAYNYYASCSNGFYVTQWAWSGNKAIHHNIVINTSTTTYCDYIYCSGFIYRCYFNRYLYGPHANSTRRSKIYTLDCYLGNAWDVTNPNGNGTYTTYWQGAVDSNQATNTAFDDINTTYSICDNFKYDGFREEKRDVIRLWDSNERSWKVYPDFDYNSTSYYCGFGNTFFLPAGAKAFITGTIKLIYSAATNYPYLWVGKVGDLYYGGQYNGYDGITDAVLSPASSMINKYIGFRSLVRFTSACKTNYESITTTIGPYTDDMFIKTSVVSLSNTTGEIRRGWYERDMRISIDNPFPMTAPLDAFSTLSTRIPITYKKTADETRIVWGGRGG